MDVQMYPLGGHSCKNMPRAAARGCALHSLPGGMFAARRGLRAPLVSQTWRAPPRQRVGPSCARASTGDVPRVSSGQVQRAGQSRVRLKGGRGPLGADDPGRAAPPHPPAPPVQRKRRKRMSLSRLDGAVAEIAAESARALGLSPDEGEVAGDDTNGSTASAGPEPTLRLRSGGTVLSNYPFSLSQLEALHWVAERRGVYKVAEWSGLDHNCLRGRLLKLQQSLGVQLWSRTMPPWRLSEAGVVLYHYSSLVIAECKDAVAALEDLKSVRAGRVRLGGSQTVGVELMPRLVRRFLERHPGVEVQLAVESTRKIALAVASGDLDAALVGGVVPASVLPRGVRVEPYLSDRIALVCAPDDPVWSMGPISASHLQSLRFVSINRNSSVYRRQSELLSRRGVDASQLHVAFEVNSVEAVKNAVEEGIGVAFVSAAAAMRELKEGLLKEVCVEGLELSRHILMLTNERRYQSKAAAALVEAMWEMATEMQEGPQVAAPPRPLPHRLAPATARDGASVPFHTNGAAAARGPAEASHADAATLPAQGARHRAVAPGTAVPESGVSESVSSQDSDRVNGREFAWEARASRVVREGQALLVATGRGMGGSGRSRNATPAVEVVGRYPLGDRVLECFQEVPGGGDTHCQVEESAVEGRGGEGERGAGSGIVGEAATVGEGQSGEHAGGAGVRRAGWAWRGVGGGVDVRAHMSDLDALRPEAERFRGVTMGEEEEGGPGGGRAPRTSGGDRPEEDFLATMEEPIPVPFLLEELAVFLACASRESIKGAAEALGMTSPGTVVAVKSMEGRCGCSLFQRHRLKTNYSSLSVEGEALLPFAERVLRLCTEAVVALRDMEAAEIGAIHLGASHMTGTYLMPRLVSIFKSRHPGVSVKLTVGDSPSVCESVARGDLDAAIVANGVPAHLEGQLSSVAYTEDEVVMAVGLAHPLAKRGVVDVEELYAHDFITLNNESNTRDVQRELIASAGVDWSRIRESMQLNSVEAIKSAVQFNLGVAFLSTAAVAKKVDLGLLCKVRIRGRRLARKLHLVTGQRRYHTRAARAFMHEIFNVAMDVAPGHVAAADIPFLRQLSVRPWEMPHARGGDVGRGGSAGNR